MEEILEHFDICGEAFTTGQRALHRYLDALLGLGTRHSRLSSRHPGREGNRARCVNVVPIHHCDVRSIAGQHPGSQRQLDKPPVYGRPCSTVVSFDRGFDGYPGADRIG